MSLFITLFCLLFIVIGVLLALHMGLYRTLLRIGTGLAAITAAVNVTLFVSPIITESILSSILSSNNETIGELFSLIPSLKLYASEIVSAIVSIPMLMVTLLLFAIIFGITYHATKKFIPSAQDTDNKYLLIPAGAIGAVMGLVCACLILTPFACAVDVAVDANDILASNENTAAIAQEIHSLDSNIFIKLSASAPISTPYDIVTSYNLGDESSDLRNSAKSTAVLFSNIFLLSESTNSELDTAIISDITESVKNNTLLKVLGAEFIANSALRLNSSESVLGLTYDGLFGELSQSAPELVDSLLDFLSETTVSTIEADITTVSELLIAINNTGLLDSIEDTDGMISVLSNAETVKQLVLPITKNERASGLIDAIVYLGIKASAEMAGIPADNAAVYDKMLSDISDVLVSDSEDNVKKEDINRVLVSYGIELKDETISELVSSTSSQGGKDNAASAFVSAADELSKTDSDDKDGLSGISDSNNFVTDRTTVSSILDSFSNNKTENSSTPEEKADKISSAVSSVVSITQTIGTSGVDISSETISTVGNSVSSVLKSDLIDKETMKGLVSGIFENAPSSSGVDLNSVADSINNAIDSDESGESVENLANNAAAGLAISESIAAGEKVDSNDVKSLISTMTTDSANALKASVTEALFSSGGASDKKAEVCNDLINNAVNNIEKFDTADENILAQEAESLTVIINFTSDITDNKENVFDTLALTPTELVNHILASEIVSETVAAACQGEDGIILDPYGFASSLDDQAKSEIETALKNAADNNSDKINDIENISALLLGKTW